MACRAWGATWYDRDDPESGIDREKTSLRSHGGYDGTNTEFADSFIDSCEISVITTRPYDRIRQRNNSERLGDLTHRRSPVVFNTSHCFANLLAVDLQSRVANPG